MLSAPGMWETVKSKVDRYLAQSLTMCNFALCRNDSALWSVSTLNFIPAKKGSHCAVSEEGAERGRGEERARI